MACPVTGCWNARRNACKGLALQNAPVRRRTARRPPGVAQGRHVHADLVRAPGVRAAHQAHLIVADQQLEVGARRFARVLQIDRRHAQAIARVRPNGA